MTATAVETPVVEVGSIFECSWGYDQTNVDFYKVVEMSKSGKTIKVVKVGLVYTEQMGPHDKVVAGGEPVKGGWVYPKEGPAYYDPEYVEVMTKRLRLGGYGGASFNVASYADAYLWDGKALYQTGYGYGH